MKHLQFFCGLYFAECEFLLIFLQLYLCLWHFLPKISAIPEVVRCLKSFFKLFTSTCTPLKDFLKLHSSSEIKVQNIFQYSQVERNFSRRSDYSFRNLSPSNNCSSFPCRFALLSKFQHSIPTHYWLHQLLVQLRILLRI